MVTLTLIEPPSPFLTPRSWCTKHQTSGARALPTALMIGTWAAPWSTTGATGCTSLPPVPSASPITCNFPLRPVRCPIHPLPMTPYSPPVPLPTPFHIPLLPPLLPNLAALNSAPLRTWPASLTRPLSGRLRPTSGTAYSPGCRAAISEVDFVPLNSPITISEGASTPNFPPQFN